jgi:hypothetical protein
MIAGLQDGEKQGRDRSHAGSKGNCRRRALDRANRFFQRVYSRVRNPRITKSFVDADGIVHKRTGLVDGKQDRAGVGIQRSSAMNRDSGNVQIW